MWQSSVLLFLLLISARIAHVVAGGQGDYPIVGAAAAAGAVVSRVVSKGTYVTSARASADVAERAGHHYADRVEAARRHALDTSQKQQQPLPKEQEQDQGQGHRSQNRFPRRGWLAPRQQQPLLRERVEDGEHSSRKRGPISRVARLGTELRSRARHHFPPAAERGELLLRQECRRGVVVAGAGTAGTRVGQKNSLAFGNFLATKPELTQAGGEKEELSSEELALQAENDLSVEAVLSVIESDGWEHVTTKSNIVVVRKFMPPPPKASSESDGGIVDKGAAAKFACVKAMGTLNADAKELYKLFLDNERVHEYNDNCKEVRDLEQLSSDTKVSWAATPRYGPFKSRDFVTVVHYRMLNDGTMMVVNRPVEHPAARRGKKYVRAEILIATNIMRPNREDPTKTDFISVTHINPGGIVDSRVGAKIANKLCAKAPVNLLVALERCANSPSPAKRKEKRKA